jgi:hypothetical protein
VHFWAGYVVKEIEKRLNICADIGFGHGQTPVL